MNVSPLHKSADQRRRLAAYRLRCTIARLRRERDTANRKAAVCRACGKDFVAELHEYDAWVANDNAADAFHQLVPLMNPGVARLWKALA